jgi:hypothetical protein
VAKNGTTSDALKLKKTPNGAWIASMIDRLRRWLSVSLLLSLGVVQAESLVVDGRPAGRIETDLVSGAAYVSLTDAQNALGFTSLLQNGVLRITRGADTTELNVVELREDDEDNQPANDVNPSSALRSDGRTFVPIRDVLQAFGVTYDEVDGRLVAVTPRPQLETVEVNGHVVTVTFSGAVTWRLSSDPLAGRHALVVPRASGTAAPLVAGEVVDELRVQGDASGVEVSVTATARRAVATAVRDGAFTRVHIVLEPYETAETQPVVLNEDPTRLLLDLDRSGLTASQARRWEVALSTLKRRMEARGVRTRVLSGADNADNPDARRSVLAVSEVHLRFVPSLDAAGEARVWRLPNEPDAPLLPAIVRRADPEARSARELDDEARTILMRLNAATETDDRLAEALTGTLFERAGLLVGDVQQAPLPALVDATGRAVLIETSPDAVQQMGFIDALEAALMPLTEGGF